MWQDLRESIHHLGCELVTVALDATGGYRARKFLEVAAPRHPALIDRRHETARLFGFVNVPGSVWIDEDGMLVRPAEHAPRPPGGRVPPSRPLPDDIPDRMRGIAEETTRIPHDTAPYHEALRDWVDQGPASVFALSPQEMMDRFTPRDEEIGLAHAHFELATHLESEGRHDAAVRHFRQAQQMAPANWLFRRQAWSLEPGPNRFWQGPMPNDPGSWPYEGDWLTDIRREGAESYYGPFRP